MNRESKICTKCKVEKPLTDYHRNSGASDGRACACKTCLNEDIQRRHKERREERKKWFPI